MKFICLSSLGKRFRRKNKPEEQRCPPTQVAVGKDIDEGGYSEEEGVSDNGKRQPAIPLRNNRVRQPNPPSIARNHRAGANSDDQHRDLSDPSAAPQPSIVIQDPQGRETLHTAPSTEQSTNTARALVSSVITNSVLHIDNEHEPGGTGRLNNDDQAAAASSAASDAQDQAAQSSFQSPSSRLPRTLSHKLPDRIDRKSTKEARMRAFGQLSKDYVELIKGLVQNPNPAENVRDKLGDSETYINTAHLRRVLTRPRLDALLALLPGQKIHRLDRLYEVFPCTIAILLLIGWRRWDTFSELFYKQRVKRSDVSEPFYKEREWPDSFTRCDLQLPFKREELAFLDDPSTEIAFYTTQSMFKPHIFTEIRGELNSTVPEVDSRLPFLSKSCKHKSSDSERPIYKVAVDEQCIERVNPSAEEVEFNAKPELYAMKKFNTEKAFRKEMASHWEMKMAQTNKAQENFEHVVVNVTAFKRHDNWYSLYPWADNSLMELINGDYSDYSDYSDYGGSGPNRFCPQFILEQLEGLVCALKFLHDELQIRHFDIKPANILVYNILHGKCGIWKFTDFGLSHAKGPHLLLVSSSADRDERSSVPAPRSFGPYQPPEMTIGEYVNSQSDMFSMGAVMLAVWAFLVGGPDEFEAFHDARSRRYQDEVLFCCRDSHLALKPEVEQWQARLVLPQPYAQSQWAKVLMKCIWRLLLMDRSERPSANDIWHELRGISLVAEGCPQLWSYQSKSATVLTENALQLATTARTLDPIDGRGLLAATLGKPHFAKLEAPDTFTAKLSSQWVVFVAPCKAYAYNLQNLLCSPMQWNDDQSSGMRTLTAPILDSSRNQLFDAPENATFESACISGSFLVLTRSTVTSDTEKVNIEFWNLDTKTWRMHDLPAGCIDVIVSAQGVLAFVFNDRVETKLSDGVSETIPNTEASERIRKVAFSHDGDYLCVWSVLDNEMRWKVWLYNDSSSICESKEDSKHELSETPSFRFLDWRFVRHIESSESSKLIPPKRFTLRSTISGPNFFACGDDGRFWFINCDPNESLREDVPTRKHDEGDINFTIPLLSRTLTVLQRMQGHGSIRLWGLTPVPKPDKKDHHLVKLTQNWQVCQASPYDTILDAQRVEVGDAEALLFVHNSGLLELRSLRDR